MSIDPEPSQEARPAEGGRLRVGAITGALLIAAACLGVGGLLGTWQWQRAHQQAEPVEPDPRAPIADVMRPAEGGRGEGRLVEVDGTWADASVALVAGKEIDGEDAVVLVRALTVDGSATGTGAEATLPVLSGWLPADEAATAVPTASGPVHVTGYVRGGEGGAAVPDEAEVAGAMWVGSMSTAVLAQEWPAPMYSYLVVADNPAPGWNALPAPPEQQRIDIQSATYAIEWWIFGLFGAVLALRWIRDNGRTTPAEEEA